MVKEISIIISANTVAWFGAIVASISLVFGVYNILRDRPKLKIQFQKDVQLMNTDPLYDSSKTYVSISVINRGRRPIRIESAGLRTVEKGKYSYKLFSDSFCATRPKILNEESPRTDFFAKQELFNLANVWYVYAVDGFGRTHKKYLHKFPTIWRVWQWFKLGK